MREIVAIIKALIVFGEIAIPFVLVSNLLVNTGIFPTLYKQPLSALYIRI